MVRMCVEMEIIDCNNDELYHCQLPLTVPESCPGWGKIHILSDVLFIVLQYVDTQTQVSYIKWKNNLQACNLWGFHRSGYEEYLLLGYKNPVRTPQETHYVSATELSRLMICKIWGFHCPKNPVRTLQETHYVSTK
jgi:hypothetical protein